MWPRGSKLGVQAKAPHHVRCGGSRGDPPFNFEFLLRVLVEHQRLHGGKRRVGTVAAAKTRKDECDRRSPRTRTDAAAQQMSIWGGEGGARFGDDELGYESARRPPGRGATSEDIRTHQGVTLG